MATRKFFQVWLPALLVCLATAAASAQSFRVQCPSTTSLHPSANASGPYMGPTSRMATIVQDGGTTFDLPYVDNGGAVKCQQISGGDGFATMGDGTQTYLFGFGPLSGVNLIQSGQPGTQLVNDFKRPFDPGANFLNGQPNPTPGIANGSPDGAVTDVSAIMDTGVMNTNMPAPLIAIDEDDEFFLTASPPDTTRSIARTPMRRRPSSKSTAMASARSSVRWGIP